LAGGGGVRAASEIDRHRRARHHHPTDGRIAEPSLQDLLRDRSAVFELGATGRRTCDSSQLGHDDELGSTRKSTDRARAGLVRVVAVAIAGSARATGHLDQRRGVALGWASVRLLAVGSMVVAPELIGDRVELRPELSGIFEVELAVEACAAGEHRRHVQLARPFRAWIGAVLVVQHQPSRDEEFEVVGLQLRRFRDQQRLIAFERGDRARCQTSRDRPSMCFGHVSRRQRLGHDRHPSQPLREQHSTTGYRSRHACVMGEPRPGVDHAVGNAARPMIELCDRGGFGRGELRPRSCELEQVLLQPSRMEHPWIDGDQCVDRTGRGWSRHDILQSPLE